MIPSGSGSAGGAYHSLTSGNGVDIQATSTNARWNPSETTAQTPPGVSIAADPSNANRQCFSTGSLNSLGEADYYRFRFQSTTASANSQIDERPSTLYIEFEMYMDWTRVGGFGGDQWIFFNLVDAAGRGAKFINHGTTFTSIGNNTSTFTTIGIPATKSIDNYWLTGNWKTVRVVYTKSSNPGTTVDGTIQLYSSNGSFINGDTLSFVNDLAGAGTVTHYGDKLDGFTVGGHNVNAYTASACNVYFRNIFYSTTSPGSLTSTTPWFQYPKVHIGQQTKSATSGKVKSRAWYRYDKNQYSAYFVGVDVTYQVKKTSDAWAAATDVGGGTLDDTTDNISAATLDGLEPNTSYDVRAVLEVDSGSTATFTTPTSTFRTRSAPGTPPITFKVLTGSCTQHYNTHTPFSGYDTMLAEGATNFIHLGDMEYLDVEGGYSTNAGTYIAIGTSAQRKANSSRLLDRTATCCQFERVAASMSTTWMWDDHEVANGWGGAWDGSGAGSIDFTSGDGKTLVDETEAVFNQWGNCRLFVTNNDPSNTTNTVHYSTEETAKTLWIHFDTRRFTDRSTTVLGATQLAWARAAIQGCTRPILFLVSPDPFQDSISDSSEGWMCAGGITERATLFADVIANTAIKTVVLVSGDRHYVAITDISTTRATLPANKFVDLSVSPLNQLARDTTSDDATLPARARFVSQFGKTTSQIARGYLCLTVNEASETVTVEVKNAEAGTVLYAASQSTGSGGGGRLPRLDRLGRIARI